MFVPDGVWLMVIRRRERVAGVADAARQGEREGEVQNQRCFVPQVVSG